MGYEDLKGWWGSRETEPRPLGWCWRLQLVCLRGPGWEQWEARTTCRCWDDPHGNWVDWKKPLLLSPPVVWYLHPERTEPKEAAGTETMWMWACQSQPHTQGMGGWVRGWDHSLATNNTRCCFHDHVLWSHFIHSWHASMSHKCLHDHQSHFWDVNSVFQGMSSSHLLKLSGVKDFVIPCPVLTLEICT